MKYILTLLILLCACATAQAPTIQTVALEIHSSGGWAGTAFVIARDDEGDVVMTAGHVVERNENVTFTVGGVEAEVVGYVKGMTPYGYADLGVLLTKEHLPVPALPLGNYKPGMSAQIHTRDEVKWAVPGQDEITASPVVEPGDSGSPMVQDGHLVGVVWGYRTDHPSEMQFSSDQSIFWFMTDAK